MILYVVLNTISVTNAHINASTSSRIEEARPNDLGTKVILGFDDSSELSRSVFVDEIWYTIAQLEEDILSNSEWDIE